MLYCKTINEEIIVVQPLDDVENSQCIHLVKHGEEPTLSVYMYDDNYEWDWGFDITVPSDYERIKLCIFEMISECDTMVDLGCTLDSIFREMLDDILIVDIDECEDCCGCEGCGYYQ